MMKQSSEVVAEMRFVLYRYCLSLTRSTWDAEDLVQETCLRALPVMNGALAHPNPTAYLLRTAKNIAVDQSRRNKIADRTQKLLQHNVTVLNRLFEESAEMEYLLSLLIQHLSPLQRTVFLLKELFGYKNAESASKLSTSEGAVKAALHRARAAIERLVSNDGCLKPDAVLNKSFQADTSLIDAYVSAVRAGDPQALIVLAQAEDHMIDSVQAVGQLNQLGQRFAATGTSSSSISMMFAA